MSAKPDERVDCAWRHNPAALGFDDEARVLSLDLDVGEAAVRLLSVLAPFSGVVAGGTCSTVVCFIENRVLQSARYAGSTRGRPSWA